MIKKYRILFMVLLAINYFGCKSGNLKIEPIDSSLNERLRTGKGLDLRLFSTKEVFQYYEISNYSQFSSVDFQLKLDDFVKQQYTIRDIAAANNFTILFYKKAFLVNYEGHVYEAARDEENGTLSDYKDNLIALIRYTKGNHGLLIRQRVLYP
ncbi:hypothetical protein [Pedobacter metabolipauper]|uniref:Uncharacterized protein n=1 Tax=Pedobacter metabolipauper TaxID=425513 RepID=A0A4R6SQT8_9SPHI|nr:hypothetical protein [Pedobacter metabolipauper]TDQ07131.1 hypothetical protein ATK78_4147 [Pedobacter metabolipauper]